MKTVLIVSLSICFMLGIFGCDINTHLASVPDTPRTIPRAERWGIYALDLATEEVELLHSAASKIGFLNLSKGGGRLAFSQQFAGDGNENEEICTIKTNGTEFERITENTLMDVYPVWSPDGNQIAFLSWRKNDLDVFIMSKDGSNQKQLYDSGSHDADIDWVGSNIAFTSGSQIWMMQDDGTAPVQLTDPKNAGTWGDANLPFGDYDPRLSPDAQRIIFERLEDDTSPHGNYNIFMVDVDGLNETRLTDNGYSQGTVSWSHAGTSLVFVVAAIDNEGKYDIYMMNSDGSDIRNINPDYFPPDLLCHTPVFSIDDSTVYFVGEWWE